MLYVQDESCSIVSVHNHKNTSVAVTNADADDNTVDTGDSCCCCNYNRNWICDDTNNGRGVCFTSLKNILTPKRYSHVDIRACICSSKVVIVAIVSVSSG